MTRADPPPGSPPPAAAPRRRRSRGWLLAVALATVLLFALLGAVHHRQLGVVASKRAVEVELAHAQADVQQAVLHLRFDGNGESPWQARQGLALLAQADAALARIGGATGEADRVRALAALLARLPGSVKPAGERAGGADAELQSRLLVHEVYRALGGLGQAVSDSTQAAIARTTLLFNLLLGLAAAVLGGLLLGLLRSDGERGRALDELARSEGRMRTTLATLAEGVIVYDARGDIRDANAAALRLLGMGLDEMRRWRVDPGMRLLSAAGEPLPRAQWPSARAMASGRSVNDTVIGLEIPGQATRWLRINAEPFIDDAGTATQGVVLSFSDVGPLRQQARELAAHRDRLEERVRERTRELSEALRAKEAIESFSQLMTDHQPTLLAYWDRDLRLRFANCAYLDWFGLPHEEAIGMHLPELLGPAYWQHEREAVARTLAGEQTETVVEQARSGGRPGHFWVHRVPDRRSDPIGGYFLIATNITELRQAQLDAERARAAMAQAEALTRLVADNIPAHVSFWGLDHRLRFANRRFAERLGREPAALVGRTSAELCDTGPADDLRRLGQAALSGAPQGLMRDEVREGRPRTQQITVVAAEAEGQVQGLLELALDVTDLVEARRDAERLAEVVARGEAFLRRVADNIPAMVGYWDRELRCRFANQAYLAWFGRRADEVIGQPIAEVLG